MPKSHVTQSKEPITQEVKKPTKSRSNITKKNVLKILFWVVVLFLVGFISFTVSRNKALAANRPAEKALVALKSNDPAAVYNLGTDEFKKVSDQKQVKSVVEQWSKVINQDTSAKPELISKQASKTKDGKELTTLVYAYTAKSNKSKPDQKDLLVKIITQKINEDYKLYTFTIDRKQ